MKTCRFLGALLPALFLSATFNLGAQDEQADQPKPAPKKPLIMVGATPASDAALKEKLRAAAANLSPQVQEIVKMSDAGIDSAVIQQYVESSTIAYNPRSEELIYLHDHGIADSIITAMIQRGAKLRDQSAAALASAAAASAAAAPASEPTHPIVVSAPSYPPAYSYPAYDYGYYNYPYYYNYWPYPAVSFYVAGRPFFFGHNFNHHFDGHHGGFGFHHSGQVVGGRAAIGGQGAIGTLRMNGGGLRFNSSPFQSGRFSSSGRSGGHFR